MEEILASIRRIIADDQVLPLTPRPAAAPPKPPSPIAAVRPAEPTEEAAAPSVDHERRVEKAPAPVAAPPAPTPVVAPPVAQQQPAPVTVMPPPPPPVHLPAQPTAQRAPDIAAVRSGPLTRSPARDDVQERVESLRREDHARRTEEAFLSSIAAARKAGEPEPRREPMPAPFPEQRLRGAIEDDRSSRRREDNEQAVLRAVSEAVEASVAQEVRFAHVAPKERDTALLSPSVDASVSSSFQALATTMMTQHTEMIEGAVRDMLRPMLKQWLDDNLPTMVERLVRAEIERVARGGR